MAKDHSKFVVLEACKADGEWMVRNCRISYDDKVAFDVDKGVAEANRQKQAWQAVESGIRFRVRVLSYENFRSLGVAA